MPKARLGGGSNGRVHLPGKTGGELPVRQSRRFPLVSDCTHGDDARVCRQTECCYHLEHRGYGEHRLRPTRDCALVVASEGEHTLEEVAAVLGVSRERVRQIEEHALRKLRRIAVLRRQYGDD